MCTKHINVRYLLIMDQISKEEVHVEWCPTKDMVANFMTKPLQGTNFQSFWNLIMGSLLMREARKFVTCDQVKEANHKDLVDE